VHHERFPIDSEAFIGEPEFRDRLPVDLEGEVVVSRIQRVFLRIQMVHANVKGGASRSAFLWKKGDAVRIGPRVEVVFIRVKGHVDIGNAAAVRAFDMDAVGGRLGRRAVEQSEWRRLFPGVLLRITVPF